VVAAVSWVARRTRRPRLGSGAGREGSSLLLVSEYMAPPFVFPLL
jgi:hypothetical protein